MKNKIYNGDCFEIMKQIPNKSIDMVFSDLPYNMTSNSWDCTIDLELLFNEYERIVKINGVLVFTASQPFTSHLIMQRPKWFKCEWIWVKNAGSNFGNVKFMPMKEHESIIIFSNGGGKTTYNPIMQERSETGKLRQKYELNYETKTKNYHKTLHNKIKTGIPKLRYPSSIQKWNRERGLHPTQKPLNMLEYFIKTYSNKGEIILDNCAGSCGVAVASENLGRNWICIEKELEYCKIGEKRLKENKNNLRKFLI